MSFQIFWQNNSMTIVYSGQTSAGEILEVVKRQHGDERFDYLRRVLHDFSGIESCSSDEETLHELDAQGAGASYTNPHLKIAIVARHPDVIAMVDFFMKIGVTPYPMKLFPAADMAEAWLAER